MNSTITLPRSVVEQALDALKIGHESAHECAETFHIEMAGYKQQRHEELDAEVKQISDAIDTLRAALEQPQGEQEPVAWIEHEWSGSGLRHLHFERPAPTVRDEVVRPVWTPLYAHPQPKPLTDEEITEITFKLLNEGASMHDFARAIERAHKIGGEA